MEYTPFTVSGSAAPTETVASRQMLRIPRGVLTGVLLYLAAVLAIFWVPIGDPPWHQSWEDYAGFQFIDAWVESPDAREIFRYTDGLAADSARGPMIGPAMWVGYQLGGTGYAPLRAPLALFCALAVPLLWRVGRRVIPDEAAILAALLFALSPVWVFYARNLTSTAASLLPMLIAVLGVLAVLQAVDWQSSRRPLLVLVLGLLGTLYAYTPVRLIWPMATVLLLAGALIYRTRWRRLLLSAAIAAVSVPCGLIVIDFLFSYDPSPRRAIAQFFSGANEQVLGMAPESVNTFLSPERQGTGIPGLIQQNIENTVKLFLNIQTLPVRTDYWNTHGRFWTVPFLLFALMGVVALLARARKERSLAPLAILAIVSGFVVAPIFTSLVHVGRLVPALPLLMIVVAAGAWGLGVAIAKGARGLGVSFSSAVFRWLPMAAVLVRGLAFFSTEASTPVGPTRQAREADTMAAAAHSSRRVGIAIARDPALGDAIEPVRMGAYRLALGDGYLFLNDNRTALDNGDRIPVRYFRTVPALEDGTFGKPCNTMWFVQPEVQERFFAAFAGAGCEDTSSVFVMAP
ncbi:MAG: glycosyltransferase family 39 protein [Chloroflexota bacterium]